MAWDLVCQESKLLLQKSIQYSKCEKRRPGEKFISTKLQVDRAKRWHFIECTVGNYNFG